MGWEGDICISLTSVENDCTAESSARNDIKSVKNACVQMYSPVDFAFVLIPVSLF